MCSAACLQSLVVVIILTVARCILCKWIIHVIFLNPSHLHIIIVLMAICLITDQFIFDSCVMWILDSNVALIFMGES
jgi:hypothetical protein